MAAGHIQIVGFDMFLEDLYSSWIDEQSGFNNPRRRASICATVICSLTFLRRIDDAKAVFRECERLNAWDPKLGHDTALDIGYKTEQDIAKICQQAFEDAQDALRTFKR